MNDRRGSIRGMTLAAVFLLVAAASFFIVPLAGQNVSSTTVWAMILLFVVLTFVGAFLRSPVVLIVAAGISFTAILLATAFALPFTLAGWLLITGGQIYGAVHFARRGKVDEGSNPPMR